MAVNHANEMLNEMLTGLLCKLLTRVVLKVLITIPPKVGAVLRSVFVNPGVEEFLRDDVKTAAFVQYMEETDVFYKIPLLPNTPFELRHLIVGMHDDGKSNVGRTILFLYACAKALKTGAPEERKDIIQFATEYSQNLKWFEVETALYACNLRH